MSQLKVAVVDGHRLVRQVLTDFLDTQPGIEVVGGASTAKETVALVHDFGPAVVCIDPQLHDMPGVEAIRHIHQQCPAAKILVVSDYHDVQFVEEAVSAGANGFILKYNKGGDLINAIRSVAQGDMVLAPEVASRMVQHYAASAGTRSRETWQLSPRETEVLGLLSQGFHDRQIAERLSISPKTAGNHITSILSKLGTHSRAETVYVARQRGIID